MDFTRNGFVFFVFLLSINLFSQQFDVLSEEYNTNEISSPEIIGSDVLSSIDADYVYIHKINKTIIFEKDGSITKEINYLKNSSLETNGEINEIEAIFLFYNKYMHNNNLEIFVTGETTSGEYFDLITDESGTIYFEEINHYWFNFYNNSIRIYKTDTNPYMYKFMKFNSTGLSISKVNKGVPKIYPNPSDNYIKVKGIYDSAVLYNLLGQEIKKVEIINNLINIEDIEQGNYILRLNNKNYSIAQKIIIE